MVKKLRHQEIRDNLRSRSRKREPREHAVFEPRDWALLAVIVALVVWLQWMLGALAT